MNDTTLPASADAQYGAIAMVKRLLTEQGLVHWRKYVVAFVLMGISAACTAVPAYLVRDFINQAYVGHSFHVVLVIGLATMALFMVKGLSTYGHMLILSRIGNRIVADNQKRLFAKLLTERISFFSDRHSSEFAARLTAGAAAANQVINQIVTALGRDFLTLVGLVSVMFIQDPVLSLVTFIVFPPAMLLLRKMIRRIRSIAKAQFTGGTRVLETMQETIQGISVIKAFTLEEQAQARFDSNVSEVEREFEQDGAGRQPRQPDDGFARRHRHRGRRDLWRLPYRGDRRDAGRILLLRYRLFARQRAGQAPRPPQYRAAQRAGERAHFCSRSSTRRRPSRSRSTSRRSPCTAPASSFQGSISPTGRASRCCAT